MAMTTNSERIAANELARWLLGDPRPGCALPTADQARDALALIMEGAHKNYGAGYDGRAIHERWPGKPGSPAANAVAAEQAHTPAGQGNADAGH